MSLLASPVAQPLFTRVISHSGGGLTRTIDDAERIGREMAVRAGRRSHARGLVDAHRGRDPRPADRVHGPHPGSARVRRGARRHHARRPRHRAPVRTAHRRRLPPPADRRRPRIGHRSRQGPHGRHRGARVHHGHVRVRRGVGRHRSRGRAHAAVGVPAATAAAYVACHPELTSTALVCGQLGTDFMFRIPTLGWLDAHGPRTWSYDFRWPTPLMGIAYHCLELPFAWDVLDAEGVHARCAVTPRRRLWPTRCTRPGCGSSRRGPGLGGLETATTRTSSAASRPTRTRPAASSLGLCSPDPGDDRRCRAYEACVAATLSHHRSSRASEAPWTPRMPEDFVRWRLTAERFVHKPQIACPCQAPRRSRPCPSRSTAAAPIQWTRATARGSPPRTGCTSSAAARRGR